MLYTSQGAIFISKVISVFYKLICKGNVLTYVGPHLFLATAKPSLICGYAVFPRYIACFWSFARSNSKIDRTGLSIHITGSEFLTAVYQPIEKKEVFIAGLQPDHVYSLVVGIVTINPLWL